MSVRVRLFAVLREAAGADRIELPFEGPATVGRIWSALVEAHPDLARHAPSAAVNARWSRMDAVVDDGDEVAFLPPVSGG